MTAEQFQQLVLPHKNKLYRFALAYLDEANAKDIVQEVMLSAWEKIQDPRSVNNIEAWCMTLTRNKSLNMLKKKGRTYLQISEQYDLSSQEASPLQKTAGNEIADTIGQIIGQLPEKQRAVITLRDMEEYSYKEIAAILNLDMNHVKVLLFRARKQVKETLTRINNYGISHA